MTLNRVILYSRISCNDVQFGVDDMHTYTHLLAVALNSKLCQGKIDEALEIGMPQIYVGTIKVERLIHIVCCCVTIGRATVKLTSKMHDVAIQLASLPLLFFTQLVAYK